MKEFEAKINKYYKLAISLIEKYLAFVILVAVIIFIVQKTINANVSDVDSVIFIQQLISDILLMLLGLEVVRLLMVPSIQGALELLIFVVARKTLSPNISSQELILDIIAFSILILINSICINGTLSSVANKYFRKDKKDVSQPD